MATEDIVRGLDKLVEGQHTLGNMVMDHQLALDYKVASQGGVCDLQTPPVGCGLMPQEK